MVLKQHDQIKNRGVSFKRSKGVTLLRSSGVSFKRSSGVYLDGISSDWTLFYSLEVNNNTIARKIEAHIKKMKSKVYINNLKNYPEISEKLIQKHP